MGSPKTYQEKKQKYQKTYKYYVNGVQLSVVKHLCDFLFGDFFFKLKYNHKTKNVDIYFLEEIDEFYEGEKTGDKLQLDRDLVKDFVNYWKGTNAIIYKEI